MLWYEDDDDLFVTKLLKLNKKKKYFILLFNFFYSVPLQKSIAFYLVLRRLYNSLCGGTFRQVLLPLFIPGPE